MRIVGTKECSACKGSGRIFSPIHTTSMGSQRQVLLCVTCGGSGTVFVQQSLQPLQTPHVPAIGNELELERARIEWLRSKTEKNRVYVRREEIQLEQAKIDLARDQIDLARARREGAQREAIALERDMIDLARARREEDQARSAATIAWCDRMLKVLHSPADMSVVDDWWND